MATSLSGDPLTLGGLAREQNRLYQIAFAADRHARESPVPLAIRHRGFRVEPLRQQLELRRRNPAALDVVEEVLKKSRRDVVTPDLRHDVEPVDHCLRGAPYPL